MTVNEDRLIGAFLDLVRISSPSKKERDVADFIIEEVRNKVNRIIEDDCGSKIEGNCGNLIITKKGNNEKGSLPLIFVTHIDTVIPCDRVNPLRENGIIRSDGTTILGADDKAAVAAVIEMISLRDQYKDLPWCDLVFIFTVAEEIGLVGAKHLDVSMYEGAHAYVLDAVSDIGVITNQAPYGEILKIELHGKAAHAGVNPDDGKNAIIMGANALTKIKLGKIDEETTANIGKVEGGKARNIIPDYVRFDGEVRSYNEKKLICVRDEMLAVFSREARNLGGSADAEVVRDYDGFCIGEDKEVIHRATGAAQYLGKNTRIEASRGASDANIFNKKGLNTVVLGVGYRNPHSKEEEISERNLIDHAEWIYQIARAYSTTS